MKEKWIAPRTVIEEFTPNEYIAVCWGVCCDVDSANQYEKDNKPYYWSKKTWWELGCSHDIEHCGAIGNQVIRDANNDGKAERMIETGTDGLGNLTCTITNMSIRDVKVGDYIYWTTSASDGRVWHHEGTVVSTVTGRPNAS